MQVTGMVQPMRYHANFPASCYYGMPLETAGMNDVQQPLKNMLHKLYVRGFYFMLI